MSLTNWIVFTIGFLIFLRSSAQLCFKRYVNGKWISNEDCGGLKKMSVMQKELQLRAENEKKRVADKGWTVFQRRVNRDVDFYRNWTDYEKGFGNHEGDFWLGLEKLHEMTKERDMELKIDMITKDAGTHWVAEYSNFRIGPGSDKYRLHLSGYSGNATNDGFSAQNNAQFSSKDADHDSGPSKCSTQYEGGWWYTTFCAYSNLNGNSNKTDEKGIWWADPTYALRFSEMKFRRRS